MKIPFSPPDIGEAEIAQVADTLRSGWITTGPKTKELERQVASFCHTSRISSIFPFKRMRQSCLRNGKPGFTDSGKFLHRYISVGMAQIFIDNQNLILPFL